MTVKTHHEHGILEAEHRLLIILYVSGGHDYARTCLGWTRFSGRTREAIIITNYNFGMAKSNRMHIKPDTIFDGSGEDTTRYDNIFVCTC